MKAAIYRRYGGPEVVQIADIPRPEPKPHEVLVRVQASAVTAADSMIRKGVPRFGRLFLGLFGPKITAMGTQFAGDVIAAGAEVTDYKPGDRVFGETGVAFGAHAEFVCLAADGLIAPIPDTMGYQEAASLCDGPLTDMNFLRNLADLQPGQHILINGAAGSLGSAAVQLAKGFGAEVTGVCSARNVDFVGSLGADHVIDYGQDDFTQLRARYDVIFDTVGKSSFAKAKRALKPDGSYISPVLSLRLLFRMLSTSLLGGKRARFSATGMLPVAQQRPLLADLLQRIAAGQLRMIIDRRYGLHEITDAHAYVDTGHKRGNVILEIGQA